MKSAPLVSVIIPAYNASAFITETLESLRGQTHANFEAIIIDDGSTDDTAAKAKTFAVDERFKLTRQENRGLAGARNTGLALASGEFLAFLDADDVWLPEKLSEQLALFEKGSKANFAFSNYSHWDGEKDLGEHYIRREKFPHGDVKDELAFFNLFCPSTVMIRRDLVERTGLFDAELRRVEDWDYWLRAAENGMFAAGVWKALVRYRVWNQSLSRDKIRMAEGCVLVLEKAVRRQPSNGACQKSLRIARGHLELTHAAAFVKEAPEKAAAAIWRAWRHYPPRLKWLLWFAGARFGGPSRARVFARVTKKWGT